MFKNTSLAGTGWIVIILTIVSNQLGLDLDDGEITELAMALALIGGFIAALWGQLRRKDLVAGIIRK